MAGWIEQTGSPNPEFKRKRLRSQDFMQPSPIKGLVISQGRRYKQIAHEIIVPSLHQDLLLVERANLDLSLVHEPWP